MPDRRYRSASYGKRLLAGGNIIHQQSRPVRHVELLYDFEVDASGTSVQLRHTGTRVQDESKTVSEGRYASMAFWNQRQFYLAWADAGHHLPRLLGELDSLPALPEHARHLPSPEAEEDSAEFLVQLVKELPWGHNRLLIRKIKESALRLWYLEKCLAHGWSRNILDMQIDSALHERQGQAVTNFPATMPPADSDLAMQALKDPYVFDFLSLGMMPGSGKSSGKCWRICGASCWKGERS